MATGVSHVIVEIESDGEAAADLLHSQPEETQAENLRYEDAASMSEPTEVPEEEVCHVCTVQVLYNIVRTVINFGKQTGTQCYSGARYGTEYNYSLLCTCHYPNITEKTYAAKLIFFTVRNREDFFFALTIMRLRANTTSNNITTHCLA